MSPKQISLTNSKIRIALKQGNFKEGSREILQLVQGNRAKAKQLSKWLILVGRSCLDHQSSICLDKVIMRLWMLDMMDFSDISINGLPKFHFTSLGTEKLESTPKEEWHRLLLCNDKNQVA